MERLRLLELKQQWKRRTGRAVLNREIADSVFCGPDARLSAGHQLNLLARWNQGQSLDALQPRHLLKIAALFKVKNIDLLITE